MTTVASACQFGQLDWLKAQKASGLLPDLMAPMEPGWYPHELAARRGHLDILKWLVLESGQRIDVTANDNATFREAASDGHLNIMKWLVEDWPKTDAFRHFGRFVDATAGDNYALRTAAFYGDLAVVRWLVEESDQSVDVTADHHSAYLEAKAAEYVDVSSYLLAVTQLGLDNFRMAMRALNRDLEAVKDLASMLSARLTLTEDDLRALEQSVNSIQRLSARKL